jgi:hypothetical protein
VVPSGDREIGVYDPIESLVLDLLESVGPQPRAYQEVLDAWRTSCPRLPVWEEASQRGFVARDVGEGGVFVSLTPLGRRFLDERRPHRLKGPADVELREPREADWPAILELANQSVRDVPGAGTQEEWLSNRQRPCPVRRQWVAVEAAGLVGYAALESQFDRVEHGFRLFVVTPPERRAEIGPLLHRQLETRLGELAATEAWFIEYASDRPLLAFLGELDFHEVRRFRLENGALAAVVSKRLRAP